MKFLNAMKRLFCKHDWEKIGFRVVENYDTVYSMRHYKCSKCGKDIWEDGRFDTKGNCHRVYYYILRDYSWWQQVSKPIYDAWYQPKQMTDHELTKEEMENFDEAEWKELLGE